MGFLFILTLTSLSWTNAMGQGSLSLDLVEQHDGFVGEADLTGFSTYRVYYILNSAEDLPITVFGNDEYPLHINSTNGFWQSQFGGVTTDNINPAVFEFLPELQYDSWVGIGAEDSDNDAFVITLTTEEDQWIEPFEAGADIEINTNKGGGWCVEWFIYDGDEMPIEEGNKVLLAQLTTNGNLWGTLSLDYLVDGVQPIVDTDYGMSFGSPDELLIGCTDENALNYDPVANVNYGCLYVEGDMNGDGVVDISDILDLLGQLGCMEDCGGADLNGDGIVNIWDLLMILGFFG
jgi:hypothetical protein